MADLSSMYGAMLNAMPDYNAIRQEQQARQMRDMALLEKQRSMDEEQQLRALFARNQTPSVNELGSISPAFAQQYSKNQFDVAKQALEMQETQGKLDDRYIKASAGILGATSDQYYSDVASGMPKEIALQKFHQANGIAIQRMEQAGYKMPAQSYDPNIIDPEKAQIIANAHGIETQYGKQKAELTNRLMPPAYTPEEVRGGKYVTPEGFAVRTPPTVNLSGAVPTTVTGADLGSDIDNLRQIYQQMPTGPEKDKLGAWLADAIKQNIPNAPRFATPEEISAQKIKEKEAEARISVEAAGKRKAAELEAEKSAEREKKTETLKAIPDESTMVDLINQSFGGAIEKKLKGELASETFGIENKAAAATGELDVISSQLTAITKALYTPGAITEGDRDMMIKASGDIAKAKDPATRIAAYRRFLTMTRNTLKDHPELISQIEELAGSKVFSPRQSLKIGDVVSGHKYLGGDPKNPASWSK